MAKTHVLVFLDSYHLKFLITSQTLQNYFAKCVVIIPTPWPIPWYALIIHPTPQLYRGVLGLYAL
jgi:hypothetical protein